MVRRQISFDLEFMKRNDVSLTMIPPVRIWWISEPLRWRILLKTSRKIHRWYFFLDHFSSNKGGATLFLGGPHLPGHLCEEDLACSESNESGAWKRGNGGNVPVICVVTHTESELMRFMRCQWRGRCRLNNRFLEYFGYRDVDLVGSCNFHCKLISSPIWLNLKRFSQQIWWKINAKNKGVWIWEVSKIMYITIPRLKIQEYLNLGHSWIFQVHDTSLCVPQWL